ncbi:DUF6233 domain-containing protein [Streptomyces sp. NPDC006654]|uniref:DUF6233 domain-containing protein n=1 Tax=Streptomyces sp. NPDC006654 TaxID=3156897 RepID=UPI0033F0F6AE
MNELPPDPPRLRAILAHLDKQIADTETVAAYLRLQRRDVVAAISRAERKAIPRPVISAPKRPPAASPRESSSRPSARFVVERPRGASKAALIHISNCPKGFTASRPIEADLVRQALMNDPKGFQACDVCRPDTELGIDVA